jgi:hypothetical protein
MEGQEKTCRKQAGMGSRGWRSAPDRVAAKPFMHRRCKRRNEAAVLEKFSENAG